MTNTNYTEEQIKILRERIEASEESGEPEDWDIEETYKEMT